MKVRAITTTAELDTLETEWNDLAHSVPLLSWDWLATWWRHYGHESAAPSRTRSRQLRVLAAFQSEAAGGERLAGIAPFYLEQTLARGNTIRFLGTGEVCTDHLSLICQPADRECVAEAIANELVDRWDDWDVIELSGVDAADRTLELFCGALSRHQCSITHRPATATWEVQLPHSWDAYLDLQSKSHRKKLRRADRRVLESDRASWTMVRSMSQFDHAWPLLVDLHQRRRQSLGEKGCFASTTFHDYHREVARRLLARDQLRLSWLELDGEPIAAEYDLAGGTTTYAYQGGFDPERADHEPGRLLMIMCIKAAIAEGHRTLDLMRGDEEYKAHWRAEQKATCDYTIVPDRRLAKLRGRVVQVAGSVTEWMKSTARGIG